MHPLKRIAAVVALSAFIALITSTAPLAQCCKSKASASSSKQTTSACSKASAKTCSQVSSKTCSQACASKAGEQCSLPAHECAKMMKTHYDTHGWLGVELNFSDAEAGPVVVRVFPESPAAAAGFRAGDRLTSLNGITFTPDQSATLGDFMANGFKIGKTVNYTANRDGTIVKLQAQLVKIPGDLLDQVIANHLETAHAKDKAENTK